MARYLIVGGVAGGAGTAARLRRLDEKAEILMFERGEHVSYANCGLPYYAGGTITDRSRLFVMTPEKFRESLNITVRVRHEVTAINRDWKTIRIKNLESGIEWDEPYDTLILSPGAAPVRPPIPGIDDPAIFTLRSVADIDAIKERIDAPTTRRALVVGGGFIGLEMAENLRHRGLEVSLVEALDQVMNVIDYDMAAMVQQHLREKGIHLRVKDAVSSFKRLGQFLRVTLKSSATIDTDLVILSIGVKPDTAVAKAAGLKLGENGAITVDPWFTTSDPHIRAIGDAIEFIHPLSGLPATVPLAGPANKQARLCADNIVLGNQEPWIGTIATSIAKVFDLTVASTGLTEKALIKAKLPFAQAVTHAASHAGYYPMALQLSLKIMYNPEDGRLWGAQAVGYDGVDKRIDVIAAYIKKSGSVTDLAEFEQAYAPPFSSAKDPVNMVGFIAENARAGLTRLTTWRELDDLRAKGGIFIDVRTDEEFSFGTIPGAINIPHTEIRSRLAEIPRNRPVVLFCAIGLRGYLAERVLLQNGYTTVLNLTGGYKTWEPLATELKYLHGEIPATTPVMRNLSDRPIEIVEEDGSPRRTSEAKAIMVDACGLQCPGPIIRLKQEADRLTAGDRLTVQATDPGFARDVRSWCTLTGNTLVFLENSAGIIRAVIEKGSTKSSTSANAFPVAQAGSTVIPAPQGNGATIIVFSNDMDKALASFVLANGAAATGRNVTMFFTFWGLSVLRKPKAPQVKKDVLGSMFSMMLPKGMKKLSLSGMNFAGMGPIMMRFRMKQKKVDQLESMFSQARMAGVRMVACQMSMDIMGISAEELLDGVEIGGVASYMEAASYSGVNLFI